MKLRHFVLPLFILATTSMQAQGPYPAVAAYLGTGSPLVWSPWTSAAAFGALPYTPPSSVALYCQASAGAPWTPCAPGGGGDSGTVTSFSAGNLSPLFTTNVETSTTTPALTFALSNAAANTVFGNCTTSGATPMFCNLTAAMIPAGSGNYVQTVPSISQTVTLSSAADSLTVKNSSSANTLYNAIFTDPLNYTQSGNTSPGFILSEVVNAPTSPIVNQYLMSPTQECGGGGIYTGNQWTVCSLYNDTAISSQRGIDHVHSAVASFYSVGDKAIDYTYALFYGGLQFYNDEGITAHVTQMSQVGYSTGSITSGASTGATSLTLSSLACHANGGDGCSVPSAGWSVPDGGLLLDQTQGGATNTITSTTRIQSGLVANLGTASLTPSTAWGTQSGSCSPAGSDNYQVYSSVTCTLTMGTSPASPGFFTTGYAYISGAYDEMVLITAVGATGGSTQTVTFNSRHNWGVNPPNLFMQGGLIGQAIVTNSAWPIAWPVVGAYTSSELVFGNCHGGTCNGSSTQILPGLTTATFYPVAEVIGSIAYDKTIQISTNNAAWTNGDAIIVPPTSEYQALAERFVWSQATPIDSGTPSHGIVLQDDGPYSTPDVISASNNYSNPSGTFVALNGGYNNFINSAHRPTNSGSVVVVSDTGTTSLPYYLFDDSGPGCSGCNIQVTAANGGTFSFVGSVSVGPGGEIVINSGSGGSIGGSDWAIWNNQSSNALCPGYIACFGSISTNSSLGSGALNVAGTGSFANQVYVGGSVGGQLFQENTSNGSGLKYWDTQVVSSTGALQFNKINDAITGGGTWLTVSGSGSTPTLAAFSVPLSTTGTLAVGSASGFTVDAGGDAFAANVTDSALTSGDCVQASTGGLLTTTGSPCGSGGSSGFPIVIGSTSIVGSSTTTSIAGLTLTTAALNGTLGATTPSTVAATTLSASSTVSGTGFSTYLASPPAIGGTAPNTASFQSNSTNTAYPLTVNQAINTGSTYNMAQFQQNGTIFIRLLAGTVGSGTGMLDIRSTSNSSIISAPGTSALFLNYDHGSGGVMFGSGALTSPASVSAAGIFNGAGYATATNCSSAASPAVCGSAAAGAFVIAAATTSVVVNTTAVTANSDIEIQPDTSLGTRLTVTCNTTLASIIGPIVTARSAGVSFTVSITGTLVTNPACYSYTITN